MIDVQSQADDRNIPIQKVGVKNLRYPITVLDRKNGSQHTNASVDLYADLPSHFKGTHMSRFIEVFNRYYRDLTMNKFVAMMRDLREALEAQRSFAEVVFPYFIEKAAPVSGQRSMMSYVCRFSGESSETEDLFFAGVEVPVATVCPCSREISDRGAHNQRGLVRVLVKHRAFFWFEDLIELIEAQASSAVFTLLKREDEKHITEHAYDNPRFVEDVVREVALQIEKLGHFPWFSVEAETQESIHNHSAFAYTERGHKHRDLR